MEDSGGIEKDSAVEHDNFVVRQSTGFAELVRSKLDKRLERQLHLGLGGDCMVMVEAGDQKGCFEGLLSGHRYLSRFGVAEVLGAEESCFGRDTVGPRLVDRGLIGERKAK